ncbi:MAG: hypothetical protein DHS20C05_02550 [Hyphococcus sp.]|nr:MAG: hypothetical protein DHS20C05_02550 [Marinicaulis sp.]
MDRYEFTRLFCERPQAYAWFLGAGTSRNANLPTAEDIIADLKRRYYCSEENQDYNTKDMQNESVRLIVETYLKSREFPDRWAPEEYTTWFKTYFGDDRERQRKYIAHMLSEERVRVAIGNRVFGAFLASGLTRAAFTTNFDTVVEKSVAEISGRSLSAFHLEGAQGANAAINNEEYPFYCKLHGDFRYDSIKNLEADLVSQNDELSRSLVNAANRFGLIVAGYSGRDKSVMNLLREALDSQNPFPHGIYWMTIKGSAIPDPVSEFISAARAGGVKAELVEIETFDTLMLRLWRNLTEKPEGMDEKVRKGRVEAVSIPIPSAQGSRPLMRFNALPVSSVPTRCLTLNLKTEPSWEAVSPKLKQADHDLITTIDEGLMVWGNVDDAKKVFGVDYIDATESTFEPDWRKTGRLQIKKFLEDGIGKAFARTRPLLMRRRGPGVVLIVDQMAKDVGVFEPLHTITGKTTGTISGLTIPETDEHDAVGKVEFAEAVRISLSWNDNRLWLLLKPDVWIWPPFARRHATGWLEKRRGDRRNDKHDALLSAWISVLTDGAGRAEDITLSAFEDDQEAGNPSFTFSSRTGFSQKRGHQ